MSWDRSIALDLINNHVNIVKADSLHSVRLYWVRYQDGRFNLHVLLVMHEKIVFYQKIIVSI